MSVSVLNGVLRKVFANARHAEDYCWVETSEGEEFLVGKGGELLSVLRVDGLVTMLDRGDYEELYNKVGEYLGTLMRPGVEVGIFFQSDPEEIEGDLIARQKNLFRAARDIGLDIEDLLVSHGRTLSEYCSAESVYVCIWTTPGVLNAADVKRESKMQADKWRSVDTKILLSEGQDIFRAGELIRNHHRSGVRNFQVSLGGLGILTTELDVRSACRVIRERVARSGQWSPLLPGDRIRVRPESGLDYPGGDPGVEKAMDVAQISWAPLDAQIMCRGIEVVSHLDDTVRVGDRLYAGVVMEVLPENPLNFLSLIDQVKENGRFPWSIGVRLTSGWGGVLGVKSMVLRLIKFTSYFHNSKIDEAIAGLREDIKSHGSLFTMQVHLTTWCRSGEESSYTRLLQQQASLSTAAEAWGKASVSTMTGYPRDSFAASCPGMTRANPAPVTVVPSAEVSRMMPLYQPAGVWPHGLMFRTEHGKPIFFQPGSSLQSGFVNLIFAPPGQGKSVMMSAMDLAFCLSPGNKRLPYIFTIDIGPSRVGFIQLLRDSLPPDRRHEAVYVRLRMDPEHAINVLDLQLGATMPLPHEYIFQVNLLSLLMTPDDRSSPPDGAARMCGEILKETYKRLSPQGRPKTWSPGLDPRIDEALENLNLKPSDDASWYEVRDILFDAGDVRMAEIAQRYAVPVLNDLVPVSREPQIRNVYENVKTEFGESLIDRFARVISEAVSTYPILSRPTALDLAGARVVSLDLDEVAKGTGTFGQRQTAMMFMVARNLARHFYLTENDLSSFDERYRSWQENRIREIRESMKHLAWDEFHRSRSRDNASTVRDQVVIDMREGRKWGVMVTLASQDVHDFDAEMVEFSTSVFMLGSGTHETSRELQRLFGLPGMARVVLNDIRPPGRHGATMLARFLTERGEIIQKLILTLAPEMTWAFSTTMEDVAIRNRVFHAVGASKGRMLLARAYPGGSAKAHVERMRANIGGAGVMDASERDDEIFDQIARHVLSLAKN